MSVLHPPSNQPVDGLLSNIWALALVYPVLLLVNLYHFLHIVFHNFAIMYYYILGPFNSTCVLRITVSVSTSGLSVSEKLNLYNRSFICLYVRRICLAVIFYEVFSNG